MVATYYGFNAGFYLCALLGLISLLLVQFFVGETYDRHEKQVDVKNGGSLQFHALAFAMFMMMVGIMIIFAFLPEYEVRPTSLGAFS